MTVDKIFQGFLQRQLDEGQALAAESDLVKLFPVPASVGLPDRYLVQFSCRGLVREPGNAIVEADSFTFGISFSEEHLRKPDPRVVTALEPRTIFHPNIRGSLCCVGHIAPGMGLVDLIYHTFEIIVYRNWASHDGLNPDACQWARNHSHRFPIDPRPLKRRAVAVRPPVRRDRDECRTSNTEDRTP